MRWLIALLLVLMTGFISAQEITLNKRTRACSIAEVQFVQQQTDAFIADYLENKAITQQLQREGTSQSLLSFVVELQLQATPRFTREFPDCAFAERMRVLMQQFYDAEATFIGMIVVGDINPERAQVLQDPINAVFSRKNRLLVELATLARRNPAEIGGIDPSVSLAQADLAVRNLRGNRRLTLSNIDSTATQTYFFVVENMGDASSGAFRVQSSVGEEVVDLGRVINLDPGEREELFVTWRFSEAGVFTIEAQADPENRVRESNERNNIARLQARVIEPETVLPDLEITRLFGPANPRIPAGSSSVTRRYLYTVANNGENQSGPFTATISFDSRTVDVTEFANLEPGASASRFVDITFSGAGSANVIARVDPGNRVQESNETNNTATFRVNVRR